MEPLTHRLQGMTTAEIDSLLRVNKMLADKTFAAMREGRARGEDTFSLTHPLGQRLIDLTRLHGNLLHAYIHSVRKGLNE